RVGFAVQPTQNDYQKIKLWATGSAIMDFQLGDIQGTGSQSIALGGCLMYAPEVLATVGTGTPAIPNLKRYGLDFTHPDINELKLYGLTAVRAGEVRFGWETGTLGGSGGVVELIGCAFENTLHISRDIGADYPLLMENTISNPSGTGPSLRMFDELDPLHDQAAFALVSAYGLSTDNPTGTSIDYTAANPYRDITMGVEGQLWRFINPSFDIANGENPRILWNATTGTFQERFDYESRIVNPAGAPYQNARIYVFDDYDDTFQVEGGSSDATGVYAATLLKRDWLDGQTGTASTTYGDFIQRVLRFGQSPFEAALAVDASISQIVTLVDDTGVELSEGSADGIGYAVNELGTGVAGNLIGFTNGTIGFSEGNVVVGASSGATGTVADIGGDTADGTLFIRGRTTGSFADGEDLEVGGVKNAEAALVSGSGGIDIDYHWEWWADTEALDDSYSAQASRTAKATPSSWVLSMLKHRVQLFKRSGGDYWTENIDGEGVFISERGGGNVLYFTSDGGWEWTPPQQVTLTLTGLITGSGGSEVRIYERVGYNDTGAELGGTETAGVQFQYAYEYGGSDIPVIIVVFNTEYAPVWQHYDLGSADASLPISQGFDRVYANP
ncbi:MAG: hypothetical protein KAI64_06650, partial [Thermoplasmata archaeon]|nr:hypothetical protein [Thermoplasmata archaeon]